MAKKRNKQIEDLDRRVVRKENRQTRRAVMLRLTDAEFQRVKAAAEKAAKGRYWRVSISAFCRDAVLAALGKAKVAP